MIDAEIVFAKPKKQDIVCIKLKYGTTVHEAIIKSSIIKKNPEIDLDYMSVGIFGSVCQLEKIVEQNDRIEIYRPLLQNPMDARRNRAAGLLK